MRAALEADLEALDSLPAAAPLYKTRACRAVTMGQLASWTLITQ